MVGGRLSLPQPSQVAEIVGDFRTGAECAGHGFSSMLSLALRMILGVGAGWLGGLGGGPSETIAATASNRLLGHHLCLQQLFGPAGHRQLGLQLRHPLAGRRQLSMLWRREAGRQASITAIRDSGGAGPVRESNMTSLLQSLLLRVSSR